MVPFVHQQQAWTIGTSWGPGAFLLSWSAASFDLRKIHGQKTLYFNLTILLFHCHPLSTGYCTWNLQKDSNLWVPKNRRRSAPTRIFFHGTHRFTPIRHRHRSPRDPVARVPPGTWTRDREDAIWPKFGGRRKPNSLPTSWRFLEKTCEQVGGKISTNYCSVIENFWGQALIIIQDSTVNLFRNDIWNDP